MFNKPTYQIEDTVYVVRKEESEAAVYKTKVKSYEFSITKGWSVELEKTWSSDNSGMWFVYSMYSERSTSTMFPSKQVFTTEEAAKEAAIEFAETFDQEEQEKEVERKKEAVKQATNDVEDAKKKLEEKKKKLEEKKKELSKM